MLPTLNLLVVMLQPGSGTATCPAVSTPQRPAWRPAGTQYSAQTQPAATAALTAATALQELTQLPLPLLPRLQQLVRPELHR